MFSLTRAVRPLLDTTSVGLVTNLVLVNNLTTVMSFYITGNWMKYDDDTVSAIPADEVLKLSGGGTIRSCDWIT